MATKPSKPPSVEYLYRDAYISTKEDMINFHVPRHQQYVYHLITNKALTSDGVAWSAPTTAQDTCATGSCETSYIVTAFATTISWPGLEGFYIQELECGLTMGALTPSQTSQTTAAFAWEIKDDDESTWTQLSTFKELLPASNTAIEFTLSGYGKLGAGYNKLPLGIRLRGYRKTDAGSDITKFYVKNSSYVAIKVKKSS